MFGRTSINKSSRFLKEIPPHLINDLNEQIKLKNIRSFAERLDSSAKSNTSLAKPQKPKVEHDIFNVGDTVIHSIFGEGLVTLKKPMGGDTLYEVAFESVGTKKLMGTYARMKKK